MSIPNVLIMAVSGPDLRAWWCNVTIHLYILRLPSAKALGPFLLDGYNYAVTLDVSTCDIFDSKPTGVTKREMQLQ